MKTLQINKGRSSLSSIKIDASISSYPKQHPIPTTINTAKVFIEINKLDLSVSETEPIWWINTDLNRHCRATQYSAIKVNSCPKTQSFRWPQIINKPPLPCHRHLANVSRHEMAQYIYQMSQTSYQIFPIMLRRPDSQACWMWCFVWFLLMVFGFRHLVLILLKVALFSRLVDYQKCDFWIFISK